ncbi:unnamed protein product [Ascophyllum nodosum]
MFRLSYLSPRVVVRVVRPTITKKNNRSTSISITCKVDRCHPWLRACHDFSSTPASANNASEKVAAVTGSYYNDPMNVRYFDKVWGEEVHVGRYDLLEGDDAKLEGLERVQRATAMTNNVLMDRLFPASFVPSGETAVMDMGSGFGTFARSIATRFGCKVVCIDMSSTFNAINATRSEEAGLAEKIIIPGERSFFDTRVPSSSMSGLVSMDSFMHTNGDTDMIMKESARVLRRGSLMVFTDIMQSNTADATAMQKVYDEYGIEKFCSPETLENSGKEHGMKLVGFEDRTPNLRIHYQTLIDLIASLRSKLENVDDSMLDARSSRSSKIVEAEQGGHMSWGTFVFRKDVD